MNLPCPTEALGDLLPDNYWPYMSCFQVESLFLYTHKLPAVDYTALSYWHTDDDTSAEAGRVAWNKVYQKIENVETSVCESVGYEGDNE
jgi:hypothetical protein